MKCLYRFSLGKYNKLTCYYFDNWNVFYEFVLNADTHFLCLFPKILLGHRSGKQARKHLSNNGTTELWTDFGDFGLVYHDPMMFDSFKVNGNTANPALLDKKQSWALEAVSDMGAASVGDIALERGHWGIYWSEKDFYGTVGLMGGYPKQRSPVTGEDRHVVYLPDHLTAVCLLGWLHGQEGKDRLHRLKSNGNVTKKIFLKLPYKGYDKTCFTLGYIMETDRRAGSNI